MSAFWKAALLRPPFATLTYSGPDWLPGSAWRPGLRALAPLGKSLAAVVLVGEEHTPPEGLELRDLLWPLEREPLLGLAHVELAASLAERQLIPSGQVLASVLPAGLRSVAVRFAVSGFDFPSSITARDLAAMAPEALRRLAMLWSQDRMLPVEPREREVYAVLKIDPPWPLRPGAARQAEILEFLHDRGAVPRAMLLKTLAKGADAALRGLVKRGLVAVGPPPADLEDETACPADSLVPSWPEPTQEQAAALSELSAALRQGAGQSRLLFGITGSGKTMVYLRLAEECLASGRSAVLLAPEVALACALHRQARERLPGRTVRLFHGYQSQSKRERAFREIAAAREPVLVVGTRSALFLPVRRPGLIVLDEEHDESYKQDERLTYQAKEVAWVLARQSGALLVLGSATPDVKTFHAAEAGQVPAVSLTQRVAGSALPKVELVDLREERSSPLASPTVQALRETVEAGEQAIIMLNRRGYAPLMYCLDCGQTVKCPECSVGLTFHRARGRLVCHYCGHAAEFPAPCPACGAANFLPLGEGTEQLEEVLSHVLPPETAILRMDRDSTRRQERLEEILRDFSSGKAQVLVGTQMLSKGHHFPGVTLVAVADADLGLNLPDYRAAERTFQLIVQVSGRAGRGERPGRVLVQTRDPGNRFWTHVLTHDYRAFYAQELELRRRYGYPPFSRLALVRMSFPAAWEQGPQSLARLAQALREEAAARGVRALGPAPAPIAMLRGRKRFNCLLKAADWPSIRAVYARADALVTPGGELRLGLDLDPLNML